MNYESLAQHFNRNAWTWSIDGKDVIPDADTLQQAIDSAMSRLYTEPTGTQLSVGRLIVRKESDSFDIYVMTGEIPNNIKEQQ